MQFYSDVFLQSVYRFFVSFTIFVVKVYLCRLRVKLEWISRDVQLKFVRYMSLTICNVSYVIE